MKAGIVAGRKHEAVCANRQSLPERTFAGSVAVIPITPSSMRLIRRLEKLKQPPEQIATTRAKIIRAYSGKYNITRDKVSVNGFTVHIDYLPAIDRMLKAKGKYENAIEVIGAALYKIERDESIFLTDRSDENLSRVYRQNKTAAGNEAAEIMKLLAEEFPCFPFAAPILSSAFHAVFKQTYGDWRKSLRA